jgi:PBP1b-binding outer membrane lipoprotein LpoB
MKKFITLLIMAALLLTACGETVIPEELSISDEPHTTTATPSETAITPAKTQPANAGDTMLNDITVIPFIPDDQLIYVDYA